MIPARCAVCDAEWTLPMKLPLPLHRFVRALKGFVAAGCPECGATGKDILIRSEPDEVPTRALPSNY